MKTETIAGPTIKDLMEQMRQVERAAARQWGAFNLFGLFEREDTPGRWDVIVSAPWLEAGRKGILTITHYVSALLRPETAVLIARIVPLPPESDFVRTLNALAQNRDEGVVSTGPLNVGGVEIERGYLLVSQSGIPLMQTLGMHG